MVQTLRSPTFLGRPILLGRTVAYILIGAAGLTSGCGRKPQTPPPQAAAVPPPKPAVVLPARTPGLWEMTLAEDGSEDTPQSLQICIDPETDKRLGILGTDLSGDQCDKTVSRTGADGWGLLAACRNGNGITTEYSGSITGDYVTAYSMKLRSQTTSPDSPQSNRVANYMVTAKRTGDCATDQKPGDVVNDGFRFNLFDMDGTRPRPDSAAAASDAPVNPEDVVD